MSEVRRDNLLRLAVVRDRTGLSRTTIYRRIAAVTFPPSMQISDGLVAWYESDIDAWIQNPMGWRPPLATDGEVSTIPEGEE